MRRCLTSFALALLCAGASAAQKKTQLEAEGLTGPVRSVRVEYAQRTSEDGKTVESARNPGRLAHYDERGDYAETISYDHKGAVRVRVAYGADARGNKVQTSYDGDGKLLSKFVPQLDGQGQRVGSLILDPAGEIKQRSTFRRSADGRLMEQESYDAAGSLLYKIVYTFDARQRQTEFAFFKPSGRLDSKTVWPDGAGGGGVSHSFRYDEQGNVSSEQINAAPVVEEVDGRGNWTRQSTRVRSTGNGHAREYVSVTYRVIEYFDAKKP